MATNKFIYLRTYLCMQHTVFNNVKGVTNFMSFFHRARKTYLALFLILVSTIPLFFLGKYVVNAAGTQHYLYVIPDGSLYVYDMDNGFSEVKHVTLPTVTDARGVAVDPATASLFIPYYDKSGGATSPGWLLKYNLNTDTIVWNKRLTFSVDSPALSPDGTKLYMPESQASYSGLWHIINASDGSSAGTIPTTSGYASHNTVVSLDGCHVYLGALNHNYLIQASTATNKITKTMGPLKSGVRPFTINSKETLAFTAASGFLGFE